jgi:hypothetical protein
MGNCMILFALAVTCLGQAPEEEGAQQLGLQLRQNAVMRTVQPGTIEAIPFALLPQTGGSDQIEVSFPSNSADLNLRLPGGSTVNSSSAAGARLRWERVRGVWDFGVCNDAADWVIIRLPPGAPAGQYVVEAKLPEGAQPTRVCATAFTFGALKGVRESFPRGDWVDTEHRIYQVGDKVRISVPVTDGGQAVRGAKVEAVIRNLANTEVGRLQLIDAASNGEYFGFFQPTEPGTYEIQVTISGRKGIQIGRFQVGQAAGTLLSAGIANSDGQLEIVMRFRVVVAGEYDIQPTYTCSGKTSNFTTVKDLSPGEQEVVTRLAPRVLEQLHLVPPCELVGIHVVRKNPTAKFGADLVGWWFNKNGQWLPR